ncbi:MAG TPA: hypothetical protein VJ943_11430 [Desulfotignum sp.]|nr:hypothetical protein [Desulfotignum sp.]
MPHSMNLTISSKNCFRAMMTLLGYDIVKLFLGFSIMQAYGINPYVFFFVDVVTVPFYVLGMARLINSLTERAGQSETIFLWAVITAVASVAPYLYAAWAGGRTLPLQGWIILLFIMAFPLLDLIRRLCSRKKPVLLQQRLSG